MSCVPRYFRSWETFLQVAGEKYSLRPACASWRDKEKSMAMNWPGRDTILETSSGLSEQRSTTRSTVQPQQRELECLLKPPQIGNEVWRRRSCGRALGSDSRARVLPS